MTGRATGKQAGVVKRDLAWGVACAAALVMVGWCGGLAWAHGPGHGGVIWAQPEDQGKLEEPVALRLVFGDGRRVSARVIEAGAMGLAYVDDGEKVVARWVDLEASSLASVWPRLRGGESAESWLELGGWLSTMEGAGRQERVAFQRARSIDRAVATDEAIEAARALAAERLAAGEEAAGEGEGGEGAAGGGGFGGGGGAISGPRIEAFDGAWPELTDEQQAAYTQELREFAEPIVERIAPGRWKVAETEFFLLYTDLPAAEARDWANLLDRMYDKMRVVFRVPEGENVFRGRCLITVWSDANDFRRWFALAEGGSLPSGVLGVCSGYPDGRTHVSFFCQEDPLEFALVLVHEASHAFTHRYRSGRRIPSWVNEGLAEHVAHALVNAEDFARSRRTWSRRAYDHFGGLDDMFVMPSIQSYQYGQAWELTNLMVRENTPGYRAFIDALKDGKDVHAALEEDYGVSLNRLVRHYHQVYDRRGPMDYIAP
ncbi:MAG: hypothetical protein AAF823_13770 [Planctomycetota bacterium]